MPEHPGASISLIVPIYEEEYDIVPCINAMIAKLENLQSKDILSYYELQMFLSHKRYSDLPSYLRSNKRLKFFDRGAVNELGDMLARGIHLAAGEYVGIITPYNQIDLGIIDDVLGALENHDVAAAYIVNHSARPWYRMVASEINTFLVNLFFGLGLKYYHLCFFRTSLVKRVQFTTDSHAAMVEAIVWLAKSGAKLIQIPFTMIPHDFKSKSHAFRIGNVAEILWAYPRLFWKIRILGQRISLTTRRQ